MDACYLIVSCCFGLCCRYGGIMARWSLLRIAFSCLLFIRASQVHAQEADPSFAPAFREHCTRSYPTGTTDMFALADGSILHVGSNPRIDGMLRAALRTLPDGAIDSSWGATTLQGWSASAAAWHGDNALVMLYRRETDNLSRVVRVFTDGTIDSAFASEPFGSGYPTCLSVDDRQRVVVAGRFRDARTSAMVGALRLTPSGVVDDSFTAPTIRDLFITGITMLPGGEFLVHGSFRGLGGTTATKLAKLSVAGTVDTSFIPAIDTAHSVVDVHVVGDGGLLVATTSSNTSNRYTSTLVVINADGTARTPAPAWDVSQNIIQGVLPLGGNTYLAYGSRLLAYRRDPAVWYATVAVGVQGVLDRTVGEPNLGQINAALRQHDGAIVLSGTFGFIGRTPRRDYIRLTQSFALDDAFAEPCGIEGTLQSVIIRSDGTVVAGGTIAAVGKTTTGPVVVMASDGTLSPIQDRYQLPAYWFGNVYAIVQGHDSLERVYAVLMHNNNETDHGDLVRLLPDGSIDSTFRIPKGLELAVRHARPLPDGRAYVSGYFTTIEGVEQKYVARLLVDGSLDTTFKLASGIMTDTTLPDASGVVSPVRAMEITPDGDLVVAGRINGYDGVTATSIVRLHPNGQRDSMFAPNLKLVGSMSNDINHLVVLPDGSAVIAGLFSQVNDVVYSNIIRLSRQGTLDRDFAPDVSAVRGVQDILCDTDGNILVAGQGILRVRSDGTVDDVLLATTNGYITSMSWQGAKNIVFVGLFNRVGLTEVSHIARIQVPVATSVQEPDVVSLPLIAVPNPVDDELWLDVAPEDYGVGIDVVNMNGVSVWRDTVETSPVMVPFTQLPPGLYAICVGRRTALVVHR
ncbi:MAG: hypothetical protein FGM24_00865 [Candidatus Kapabacteria bacterium]|nr:hypothetical protein [Candidatus Kapabacteria bacterium]